MTLMTSHVDIESSRTIITAKISRSQQESIDFPFEFSCNLSKHSLFPVSRLVKLADFIASQTPEKAICVVQGKIKNSCSGSERIDPIFLEIVTYDETDLPILIKDVHKREKRNQTSTRTITRHYLPQSGARLDHDPEGNPTWHISDLHQSNKYLQIGGAT
ncbi:hypothetical protein [Leptolyngbya sp. 7M]|uniref:hypothetical protein n=1 Tax=Leptolyngbya sp. 7M TaxID=2812896 RepID=UPI001B8C0CE7|nr:hypothetical protein [Leptolyngbya sp. 7M]QYO64423.1 hypothetical protein JVX88_32860 [Leptolyngbya sp. 7M]